MKDIRLLFFFLCGMLLSSAMLFGQNSASEAKELANSAESYKDWETAIYYWEKALEFKPDNYQIIEALAENNLRSRNYKIALKWYQRLVDHDKHKPSLADFQYGRLLKTTRQCKMAVEVLNQFRKDYRGKKDDLMYLRWAKNEIKGCEGSIQNEEYKKVKVTQSFSDLNTLHMEAAPIYLDDNTIVFSAIRLKGNKEFAIDEDSLPRYQFYWAEKRDEKWEFKGKWTGIEQNPDWHYTSAALNLEKTRFYYSVCRPDRQGNMNCDLYVKSEKGEIMLPETVNSKYLESQVAVGKDYKDREVVYFVSDRKEGKGGLDIWYTTYREKRDEFKPPRNLGSKVNTIGDERSPYIHPRTRSLYFSSNGHPGYGQLDIFKTLGERSKWELAQNLGAAINSPFDDLFFVEEYGALKGVLVSNRQAQKSGNCCDDLYAFADESFTLYKINGKVLSDENQNIQDATVKVYLIEGDSIRVLQQSVQTDDLGNYELVLDRDKQYEIQVTKEGYLNEKKTMISRSDQARNLNFELEGVKDKTFILENVYYKFDRSELTQDAMNTIDTTLLPVMLDNPLIIIELSSHTDSKGTKGYNEKLSQDRAESVVKYLRKKGISKNRMVAKGYGFSKPIAPNTHPDGSDNPEGRAKNRRTEFRIIGELEEAEDED